MSDLAAMMRRVRRNVHDRPDRILVQDDPLTAVAETMSVLAGDVGRLPTSGISLCFDDASDELAITTAAADSTENEVALARGQDGTAAASHVKNTAALKSPRYDNAQIIDALTFIVENELWPEVWLPIEAPLTYQSTNDYYAAPEPDIEEFVYAYQLEAGRHFEVHAKFLSPALADDENFPDGAILISPYLPATSTIYCSFRARPSLGDLSPQLENLVVLGASAHLTLVEELGHVGGQDPVTSGRVQAGSSLRAGAVTWDRFVNSRIKERIRLQHAEQLARRHFFGMGRG
jgi:hypothetical protein